LNNETLAGAVNLAAPVPVTNREMMGLVRRWVGAPFGLPATRWMLEAGAVLMRTETELVLKSRRVVSRKLPEAGFRFQFTEMQAALAELLGGPSGQKVLRQAKTGNAGLRTSGG